MPETSTNLTIPPSATGMRFPPEGFERKRQPPLFRRDHPQTDLCDGWRLSPCHQLRPKRQGSSIHAHCGQPQCGSFEYRSDRPGYERVHGQEGLPRNDLGSNNPHAMTYTNSVSGDDLFRIYRSLTTGPTVTSLFWDPTSWTNSYLISNTAGSGEINADLHPPRKPGLLLQEQRPDLPGE